MVKKRKYRYIIKACVSITREATILELHQTTTPMLQCTTIMHSLTTEARLFIKMRDSSSWGRKRKIGQININKWPLHNAFSPKTACVKCYM